MDKLKELKFDGEIISYGSVEYNASVEFTMYEDQPTAAVHVTINKNTPSVHKQATTDFVNLLSVLPKIGVKRLICYAKESDNKVRKFQESWGFEPYKVHTVDGVDYLISEFKEFV